MSINCCNFVAGVADGDGVDNNRWVLNDFACAMGLV